MEHVQLLYWNTTVELLKMLEAKTGFLFNRVNVLRLINDQSPKVRWLQAYIHWAEGKVNIGL